MRTNKRFLFSLGIIAFWTLLTYVIIFSANPNQKGVVKTKYSETIDRLNKDIQQETHSRERIVQQYNKLIKILAAITTTQPPPEVVVGDEASNNLEPIAGDVDESEPSVVQVHLNNKIDFNGKYIDDDVNKPVIPVIVFACNRVSVSRSLDSLIKYRPNREQFPIIVSQVRCCCALRVVISSLHACQLIIHSGLWR